MSEKSIYFSQNSPVKETNLFVHLKFSDFLIVLGSSPRSVGRIPLQTRKQATPCRKVNKLAPIEWDSDYSS